MKDNSEYLKFREILNEALKKLSQEKGERESAIVNSTRFELKNKATADEILKKVNLK